MFIAVFFLATNCHAQEFNNWLLSNGTVLNFNTTPATIICNETTSNTSISNYTVALSDDNGNMLIYGTKKHDVNTDKLVYAIQNADGQDIITIQNPNLRNVIGSKAPQGGYYIAAVYGSGANDILGLHIFKLNNKGELEDEYTYNETNYSFFIEFITIDDFVALIAYRNNQIETYKLTSNGCDLWTTSELTFDSFLFPTPVPFDIEHTLDNRTIIATTMNKAYILNFDKQSGKVTLIKKVESDMFRTMTFSPTDKYFLVIDGNKLKGFAYDKKFNFVLDNCDIVYDLPNDNNNEDCNSCWEMAIGVDGKLYIHNQYKEYIIVLDRIESGHITETIIQSNCLKSGYFPRIPRKESAAIEAIPVCSSIPMKYSVDSPESSLVYHWQVSGGTLSNTTGTETYVTWDNNEGEGILTLSAEDPSTGCKSEHTEYKVLRHKLPTASFDNAQVCYGEPLNILLTGDTPYELFYTYNGDEHSVKTTDTQYSMPNNPGKYTITKVKDNYCESIPDKNNTSEILPPLNKLKIIRE